jgi:mortality factor 4-like protein 1
MPFSAGDGCYGYHGDKLFDAKVIEIDVQSEMPYKIHWQNWHARYDEWVKPERLLEKTAANEELKAASDARALSLLKRAGGVKRKASGMEGGVHKKTKLPDSVEANESDTLRLQGELKITIPDPLRRCLVEDWERVTVGHQLLPLPRPQTVESILQMYAQQQRGKETKLSTQTVFCTGLQTYFDRALSSILLYREEFPHHVDACRLNPKLTPARMYGAEHLLRLFMKLPALLVFTQASVAEVKALQTRLEVFLAWFSNNTALFGNDYAVTTTAYRERVSHLPAV